MTQAKVAPAGGDGSAGMREDPSGSGPESGSLLGVTIWTDDHGRLRMIEYGCVDWYMYEIEASPTTGHGQHSSTATDPTTAAGR